MGVSASVRVSPSTRPSVISKKQAWKRNKHVERMLTAARLEASKTVKLLLLGAGESGKSTIAKQLRLIHLEGFWTDERFMYKNIVYSNIVDSTLDLTDAMLRLNITFADHDRQNDLIYFKSYCDMIGSDDHEFDVELVQAIGRMWQDRGLQDCYRRRSEFQLQDNVDYFFKKLPVLAQQNYLPSDDDILHARLKSTGIIATKFKFKSRNFMIVDIGGQRTERRKWIHCFDDVTAILFTVALSAYNQTLREDQKTNRISESMVIFDTICNSVWFQSTSLILFFNKFDIFEEKIKSIPLTVFCPLYKGTNNPQEASRYVCNKFLRLNKNRHRQLYYHFTVATNTSNIEFVFDSCADVIVKHSLETVGMY